MLKDPKAELDYSNPDQGYIMCRYLGKADRAIAQIRKSGDNVVYNHTLRIDGVFEAIAFTEGSGLYSISVYERLDGTQYRSILTKQIQVELEDEWLPFLYASAAVPFGKDSACVKKAGELTLGANSVPEKIDAIYRYVTEYIRYDSELAQVTAAWYRSDPDQVLEAQKGICVGYAVLTAAMFRSQGIPAKVVYGTTPDEKYHAWITVYSDTAGKVGGRTLKAGRWIRLDPTFDAATKTYSARSTAGYLAEHYY